MRQIRRVYCMAGSALRSVDAGRPGDGQGGFVRGQTQQCSKEERPLGPPGARLEKTEFPTIVPQKRHQIALNQTTSHY